MNIKITNNKVASDVDANQANTSKVWLITGASRGLGTAIAKAVLAAGDKVVATGRDSQNVEKSLGGQSDNLLTLTLDVTNETQAKAVTAQAIERFGRIDVLVNNAGYALLGYLEECSTKEIEAQFRTNVFGLLSVTRAVLPVMRNQGSGHVINLSSIAGFRGWPSSSIYCASKFAVEGLSESMAMEVAPFGIRVTIVEPGFFRTDFLAENSLNMATNKIAAYDHELLNQVTTQNGKQAGDPDKLAQALLTIAAAENPPLRLAMGGDAVGWIEEKLTSVQTELNQWRELSISTDIEQ